MRRPAIAGGEPAFREPRHVGAPNIVNRAGFMERLEGLLDRRWLTNRGPLVEEFEAAIAALCGTRHCVAVTNGTVGLEVAARALDLHGEVIVPSWTFVATAHALEWQRITPVFADVDPRTHTLDPVAVRRMVTPRTTGIVGVHLWGRACDDAGLRAVADEHDLALLYDGAHALGSEVGGHPVLSLGDASVVSFHATKFLNTFEGGAVLTDDDDLAERVRLMTNFGFAGRDDVVHVGTNGKMTEVSAAMGLAQLEGIDGLVTTNLHRWNAYEEGLADVAGLTLVTGGPTDRTNGQYVVVEVDEDVYGRGRDELVRCLEAENVLARRYFWPGSHRMEPYRSTQPHAGLLLPETERLAASVLVLPTGTAMSLADVDLVCGLLRDFAVRRPRRSSRAPSRLV